jgi:hypothetical protein
MTVLNFESLTEGLAATTANSGFDEVVSAGSGGSITGQSGAALNGSRGIRFVCGTSAACVGGTNLTSSTQYAVRVPFRMPTSAPTVDTAIARLYQGATVVAQILLRTTFEIQIQSSVGSTTAQLVSAANASPYAGQYVAVGFLVDSGTTTSNGSFSGRFYATPADAAGSHLYSATQTAWNMGAGASFTRLRLGFNQTQSAVRTLDYDYVEYVSGSTTWLGGVPAASAPSVSASVSDAYPTAGATVTLASTESGTFSSATWSCTSQPPGSATPAISDPSITGPTVVVASSGRYVFRRRLVWSGGNQDSSVTVYVHAGAGQRVGIYSVTGTWASQGGAADMRAALADALDTTYAQSSDNPPGTDKLRITLNPCDLGPIKLYPRDRWSGGTGTSVLFTLYKEDGTTVVDSWTYNPGTSFADATPMDVDSTGLAAIPTRADRRALVVDIAPTV